VNYPTIWKEDKIQIDMRYLDKDWFFQSFLVFNQF
jgi:hypothetical protein